MLPAIRAWTHALRTDDRGLNTAELMGNAALAIAALVVRVPRFIQERIADNRQTVQGIVFKSRGVTIFISAGNQIAGFIIDIAAGMAGGFIQDIDFLDDPSHDVVMQIAAVSGIIDAHRLIRGYRCRRLEGCYRRFA